MKYNFFFNTYYFLKEIFNDKKESSVLIRRTCIKNKGTLIKVISLGFLQSLLEGANIYFIYLLVALITGSNNSQTFFLKNLINFSDSEALIYPVGLVLIGLIGAQFFQSILKYFFVLNTEIFTAGIKKYIREFIYQRIFKFDFITSSKIQIGRLLNLTIQVPEAIRERIDILSNSFVSTMLVISYLFILIKISVVLLLVVFVCQFLVFYFQLIPRKFLKNTSKLINLSEEQINNQLSQEMRVLKYLQSIGTVIEPVEKLKTNLKRNFNLTIDLARIRSALLPTSQFVGILILSLITLLSILLFSNDGVLQAENIVVFLFTLNRLNGKTSQLAENISFLAVNRGILNALDIFLDDSDKVFRDLNKNDIDFLEEKTLLDIEISDLNYKYPNSRFNTLKNINLSIAPGEYVAIVGESGSGKTTFIDLLTKLIIPSSGSININKHNLKDINSLSWQSHISYVGQESFVFSGSIYENIHMYADEIDYKWLDKCIKYVNLDKLINSFKEGGKTMIGEGFRRISGGQMQKLNIARALYRKPKLLILDEATSNQDVENEDIIINLLNKLRGKITIVVIAHRLNSITSADNIFLFKNGRIIESGKHQKLLDNQKEYCQLWNAYQK